MSDMELYESEAFRNELEKCALFYLKGPRGGHYNDGFELLGKLTFADAKALLAGLDVLGLKYVLHEEKPECFTPPPFELDGRSVWLEYQQHCECFGHKTYVVVGTGTGGFSIEFNFNSESWYYVVMGDVKRAQTFEAELLAHGLL